MVIILALFGSLSGISTGSAALINSDFSSGLTGWTSQSDVTINNQEAVLKDDGATDSLLYQPVALAPGQYRVEFDFLNDLSPGPPTFGFLDSFFASLYFINDLSQLDILGGTFDAVQPLFDLDANGVSGLTGSVGASSKGGSWQHYALIFLNTSNYVIPSFELLEQNFINADSTVRIDNVSIEVSVVPEPNTFLLLGSGVAAFFLFRRRFGQPWSIRHN